MPRPNSSSLAPALLERWSAAGLPASVGEELARKYTEPHRRYHTLAHLESAFGVLESDPQARAAAELLSAEERAALRIALFYHDREYEPRRHDSEIRSAVQLLADAPALGLPVPLCARVVDLVLLSRRHRPASGDRVAELFCDVDLSVLGAAPEEYDRYARGVREEYAHVEEPLYRFSRRRVLASLARRERIFHVLTSREQAAKANLARERAALAGRLPAAVLLRPAAAIGLLALVLLGAAISRSLGLLLVFLLLPLPVVIRNRGRMEERLRSGIPPFADEPRRRRLWSALSDLYLDTEVDPELVGREIAATGYSREEVTRCLRQELGPVVAGNLGWGIYPVIGEWAGFDPDWLRTEVVARACRPRSRAGDALAGWLATWFVRADLERALEHAFVTGGP